MPQHDREIPEKDRCSICSGSGWRWWTLIETPNEGKWIVCRECIGTGRSDHMGRKRQMPAEAGA